MWILGYEKDVQLFVCHVLIVSFVFILLFYYRCWFLFFVTVSALMLLVGQQKGHLASKHTCCNNSLSHHF